ncbi:MAG: hypothetical protein QXN24_01700 [Candidatus Bathyarchaeia archaeon]
MVKIGIIDNYDVCCEIDTIEDSDWDYARNKHVLIRNGIIEYSTSSFDAPIITDLGVMHGGNRDFPWQGLLIGPVNNKIYRVLDALYYRPLDAEDLKPLSIIARRDSADYIYVDEDLKEYVVTISVNFREGEAILSAHAQRPSIFLPILDIREAESGAQPSHRVHEERGVLIVGSNAAPIMLRINGFDFVKRLDLALEWVYKLDDGWRRLENGRVLFIKHVGKVQAPVALISEKGMLEIKVPLPGIRVKRVEFNVRYALRRLHSALKETSPNLSPQIINAILLRVDRLASFGVPLGPKLAPEAGSMWFRRVWTRDLLEGLRWNMLTYTEIFGSSAWFIDLVRYLILTAYRNNGLKVFVDVGDYVSDAFPQLINVVAMLYERTRERILLRESMKIMLEAYRRLRSPSGFSGCYLYDGLIVCDANSSWLDVFYPIDNVLWPTRLPLNWVGAVSPKDKFALVEVNSLFIECLCTLIEVLERIGEKPPKELYEFRSELLYGYRRWFLRDDALPPITIDPISGLRDYTRSSLGVVSVASLRGIIYDGKRLIALWDDIERLLVRRKMVKLDDGYEIFGILVRDVERRPYLGDLEYHGSVVWPRDTPYLIEVMKELGMEREIYGILINNLDHMVSEGAIGYVNELFSLPIGENPSPTKEYSSNPVPVKNYAQYWSHWCDPYIEYFCQKRNKRDFL